MALAISLEPCAKDITQAEKTCKQPNAHCILPTHISCACPGHVDAVVETKSPSAALGNDQPECLQRWSAPHSTLSEAQHAFISLPPLPSYCRRTCR